MSVGGMGVAVSERGGGAVVDFGEGGVGEGRVCLRGVGGLDGGGGFGLGGGGLGRGGGRGTLRDGQLLDLGDWEKRVLVFGRTEKWWWVVG